MRPIRSLLTAVPALAMMAAAIAVGTAAPAQASVSSAHHGAAVAGGSSAPGAVRPGLSVPPNIHPTGAKPATSGQAVNGEDSYNWSGYAAAGGTYTSVSATWVEPAETCTADGAAAFWVGLDGDLSGDDAVEQIGTTADCTSGSPVYYAWYELFPAPPVLYSDTVEPGDNLTGSVTYTGGGYYDFDLVDITRGWTENHSYYDPGQANSSAEIIAEAPSDGGVEPLPDFGSVGFSGSRINGTTPAGAGAQSITMINTSGTALDEVSADTSGGNFMITYGSGANVTGSPIIAFQANTTGLWGSSNDSGGYLGQNLAAGTSPSITALPGGGFEGAFQNSNGLLEVFGTALAFNTQLGMMAGTSPSIAANSSGFEVVFEANTGILWDFTPATGGVDDSYGMMSGTSPSIAALPNGGFETAFQANTGALWVVGSSDTVDTQAGMMAGTSPSIAANSSGSFEVAFQANTGILWDYTPTSYGQDESYGMMAGTSPSITALSSGGFETAFQANTGILWEVGSYYNFDTQLGMLAGTSPSIAAVPSVEFDVAFQANTGALWVQNLATGGVSWGSGMHTGTSPAIAS